VNVMIGQRWQKRATICVDERFTTFSFQCAYIFDAPLSNSHIDIANKISRDNAGLIDLYIL